MTSTWIPLTLLAALCAYMVHLFRLERREALAFSGAEAISQPSPAPVAAPAGGGHEPAPAAVEVPAHPAPAAEAARVPMAEPALKKKRKLIWRGWAMRIWVPLLIGFGGQAYLDLIKPLVEKAAH
jgi:hypothetical protein